MTRVLLLSGIGSNLGDQSIFAGFAKVFGEACDEAGVGVTVDVGFIWNVRIREDELAIINEDYDAVIVASGGCLYHRPDDDTPGGWAFNIPLDLLPRLRPSLAVYGVGYNYLHHVDAHFPERTAAHLRAVAAKCVHFSTREPTSAGMIRERFGVTSPIEVVPDAAIHVEPMEAPAPPCAKSHRVGLCLRIWLCYITVAWTPMNSFHGWIGLMTRRWPFSSTPIWTRKLGCR